MLKKPGKKKNISIVWKRNMSFTAYLLHVLLFTKTFLKQNLANMLELIVRGVILQQICIPNAVPYISTLRTSVPLQ